METSIKDLIEISHFYGEQKDYVIAGGGNTSFKNEQYMYIKASGTTLGNIAEEGFAMLDREKLNIISQKDYSSDSATREQQIKEDLFRSSVYPEKNLRPSVETSLHNIINYKFVIHTHPTLVNSLMCSQKAKSISCELFGDEALFVGYTDPGYTLFKKVEKGIAEYHQKFGCDPKIILLENHGIFVSADNIDEIKNLYSRIIQKLKSKIKQEPDLQQLQANSFIAEVLPAIRMILSENQVKVTRFINNSLVAPYYADKASYEKISSPFIPDQIVYCKAKSLFLEISGTDTAEKIIDSFKSALDQFNKKYNYLPKIIILQGTGVVIADESSHSTDIDADVFEDFLKIRFYSDNFGGPKFLDEKEIAFIDNWEVENYRRKVSTGKNGKGKVENKIAVITGAAQGFGAGIAENLFNEGANIVIADLNETTGKAFESKLNGNQKKNKALFVKTDVSNPESVQNLLFETIKEFGGLDIFISNAGILRAGGLDAMDPKTFEIMTKVNYMGYFICAKYASHVLKLQSKYKKDYFTDIIQINSKSGLKGSNKNFAYAGGKFGGIGLTQSFAMELMPFKIKVNSVCPGNFLDGPLWSDPEKGLFVQYLKAGKVPGAKTVEDVRRYYENQVPAKRGCTIKDVMKAVFYIIDQEYETGQAVPVTGGQIMLS